MNKRTIAIIEDDVDLLSSYADVLASEYDITLFSHPREFLDYLDKNKSKTFDGIITDYSMPQINGVQLIQSLRQKKFEFPVILISAYLTKETIQEGLQSGIVVFVDKPFTVEDVKVHLDRLISESKIAAINQQIIEIGNKIQEINSALKLIFETHFDPEYLKTMFVDDKGDPQPLEDAVKELHNRFDSLNKLKNSLNPKSSKPNLQVVSNDIAKKQAA